MRKSLDVLAAEVAHARVEVAKAERAVKEAQEKAEAARTILNRLAQELSTAVREASES